jgi:hypothetical protein
MEHLNLEAIDVDGAIREGMEEVSGDTRLSFLRKGALAGGAALSGGAILSALIPGAAMAAGTGAPPASPFGAGATGILNYALTLEYLESSYYNEVAKKGVVKSKMGKQLLKQVVKDENDHVKLLKAALKSAAIGKPSFNFGKHTSSEAEFLATGYVLENTGVHAYLGQAPNLISDPSVLVTAAEIVTVEGRHAGAFGVLTGQAIAPSPLDVPWTASKVLAAVTATKFITKL